MVSKTEIKSKFLQQFKAGDITEAQFWKNCEAVDDAGRKDGYVNGTPLDVLMQNIASVKVEKDAQGNEAFFIQVAGKRIAKGGYPVAKLLIAQEEFLTKEIAPNKATGLRWASNHICDSLVKVAEASGKIPKRLTS